MRRTEFSLLKQLFIAAPFSHVAPWDINCSSLQPYAIFIILTSHCVSYDTSQFLINPTECVDDGTVRQD